MREKQSAISDQLSAGKLGSWDAGTPERQNAGNQERPLSDGACHASHFSPEDLTIDAPSRKNASLATLGERLGDRVPASGVGRRGPFPEGRRSSRFENVAPPGTDRAGALGSPLSPPWPHSDPEGRGWDLRAGTATAGGPDGQFFGLCL